MKKIRGFTLIELLAVIVILAVIALIATPIVLNIIQESKKQTFLNSAHQLIKAGKLYYSEKDMEGKILEEVIFEFPNNILDLEMSGKLPEKGLMIINEQGEIAIAVSDQKYCVKKYFSDSKVNITEELDNCIIPNYNINSNDDCTKNINNICDNGTKVSVQVNDYANYDFYVINDTGSELTLIMNQNIGGTVSWYNKQDNTKGPLTALSALEERTIDWINVDAYNYTLEDDSGANRYSPLERKNVRARMLKRTEVSNIKKQNNNVMPMWLYDNLDNDSTTDLQRGYWLSTAGFNFTITAYFVYSGGGIAEYTSRDYLNYNYIYGVRPVITISKAINK